MVAQGAIQARGTQAPLLLCTGTATHLASLNSDWERVLGWTREELTSRPVADFVHPNDRERTIAEAGKVGLPGYEVANFENRFRARGGQWRWLRWKARADGARWTAVAVDVTDERQLQPAPLPVAGDVTAAPAPLAPAADWGISSLRPGLLAAARTGLVVICLVAASLAARDFATSSAIAPPVPVRSAELPPHMFGPVDGGGRAYSLRRATPNPPGMLGPRRAAVGPAPGPARTG